MRSEENLTWRFGAHVDPVHVARLQRSEDPFDARLICHHVLHQLELERRTSLPQLREHQRRQGIVGVPQHEHAAEVGNHLLEQVQLFVWQIKGECGGAGQVATPKAEQGRRNVVEAHVEEANPPDLSRLLCLSWQRPECRRATARSRGRS